MDEIALGQLLAEVSKGSMTPDEALESLRTLPFSDLGFARVDHHRILRQGLCEAVYAPGKSAEQCAAIVVDLLSGSKAPVLLTRADERQVDAAVRTAESSGFGPGTVTTSRDHATVSWRPRSRRYERVLVVTAGTADLPVADECVAVLETFGFKPQLLADCGVAGVHRLFANLDDLLDADAIVVIAGMEGALASLVGGLAGCPVVAVPTSVGYGSSLEGVTALLAMLASCASGVSVVGIDNGYGAACSIERIFWKDRDGREVEEPESRRE
jgi:hypothetical protein